MRTILGSNWSRLDAFVRFFSSGAALFGPRKRFFIAKLLKPQFRTFSAPSPKMALKSNEKQVLLTFDLPVGNFKVTVDNSFKDVSCARINDGQLERFDLANALPKETGYMLMARQIDGQGIIKFGKDDGPAEEIDTSELLTGLGSIKKSLGTEELKVNYLLITPLSSKKFVMLSLPLF